MAEDNNISTPVDRKKFWNKVGSYAKTTFIVSAVALSHTETGKAQTPEKDPQGHTIEVKAPEKQTEMPRDTISYATAEQEIKAQTPQSPSPEIKTPEIEISTPTDTIPTPEQQTSAPGDTIATPEQETPESYPVKQYERISERDHDIDVRSNRSIKSETTHTYDEYGHSYNMSKDPTDRSMVSIQEVKRTDENYKNGSWKSMEEQTFRQQENEHSTTSEERIDRAELRKNKTAKEVETFEREVYVSEGNQVFTEPSYTITEKSSKRNERRDGTNKVIENSMSIKQSHGQDMEVYEKIKTYRGTNKPKKAHVKETIDGVTTEKKIRYDKEGNANEKIIKQQATGVEKPAPQKVGQPARNNIDTSPAQQYFRQSRQER